MIFAGETPVMERITLYLMNTTLTYINVLKRRSIFQDS